jgi:hypothetical protein
MVCQGVTTLPCGSTARSFLSTLLSFLAAVAVLAVPAETQTTATLSGTVTDTTGAILRRAKIILTNESTRDTRKIQSNQSGYFTFAGIYPGTYTVFISAQGFRDWQKTGTTTSSSSGLAMNTSGRTSGPQRRCNPMCRRRPCGRETSAHPTRQTRPCARALAASPRVRPTSAIT